MTDNGRKLKELRDDLEALSKSHGGILAKEHTIRHPLDDAMKEARRKFNAVNDGPSHPLGLND